MEKESRIDCYGSTITDCYSNAKTEFEASKCIFGREFTRKDFNTEIKSGRLIVEETVAYKWYVCWSDHLPLRKVNA